MQTAETVLLPQSCAVRMRAGDLCGLVLHMLEMAHVEVRDGSDVILFDDSRFSPAEGQRGVFIGRERRTSDRSGVAVLTQPLKSRALAAALAGTSFEPHWVNRRHPLEQLDGISVLLVEDNPVNQRVAEKMLEKLGCRVTLANHGGEALQHLNETAFHVVLMDCQMPEMDGYEATRLIRESTAIALVPIVALTAAAFPEDVSRCRDAGMDDYLSKPVTIESLAATLRKWARYAPSA